MAQIDDEGVVVACAGGPPGGGVGYVVIGLGGGGVVDDVVGEDLEVGLVEIAVEDLVIAMRAVVAEGEGGGGG